MTKQLPDPEAWPLPGYTFLTSPPTEAMRKAQDEENWRLDRFHLIAVECWLEGYIAGEVSLHTVLRGVAMAADAGGLLPKSKELWIGRIALRAIKEGPAKEGRGNGKPMKFKEAAVELVNEANRRGFTLAALPPHGQSMTAYDVAATAFIHAGLRDVTPRKLRQWRDEVIATTK